MQLINLQNQNATESARYIALCACYQIPPRTIGNRQSPVHLTQLGGEYFHTVDGCMVTVVTCTSYGTEPRSD